MTLDAEGRFLMRKEHLLFLVLLAFSLAVPRSASGNAKPSDETSSDEKVVRIGIIGLDTSHSPAFTRVFNDSEGEEAFANFEVVAAYPYGSRTIESSYSRIPGYTEEVEAMGVEIVDSISELLTKVDVVLLETNDGHPHLEQALQVFEAGKPVFVDKPVTASLAEAVALFEAAERHEVPVFSSSSLRYTKSAQAIRDGEVGDVLGASTYSPYQIEETHPDLYWYGIHGVEALFTVMGTGCESVRRVHTDSTAVVVGQWEGGRIGTFRGLQRGEQGYGGQAFGRTGIAQIGPYEGYEPLVRQIAEFFRTGQAPVSAEETLEIYAFMTAADESKRLGGDPVRLDAVLAEARKKAKTLLDE